MPTPCPAVHCYTCNKEYLRHDGIKLVCLAPLLLLQAYLWGRQPCGLSDSCHHTAAVGAHAAIRPPRHLAKSQTAAEHVTAPPHSPWNAARPRRTYTRGPAAQQSPGHVTTTNSTPHTLLPVQSHGVCRHSENHQARPHTFSAVLDKAVPCERAMPAPVRPYKRLRTTRTDRRVPTRLQCSAWESDPVSTHATGCWPVPGLQVREDRYAS